MASRISAVVLTGLASLGGACTSAPPPDLAPAPVGQPATFWNAATVYFLLTDRFANGDTGNDHALGRAHDGMKLRNFEGGDLRGLRERIEAGWFDSLGVDAIWLTPFVEQIHPGVDEGTGKTYAFHGYWTRDWTAVDPALGTMDDLRDVVDVAHRHGMRVLMDAIINHVGPQTPDEPAWPDDWVRTSPQCTYRSYITTVTCTLVRNLPDVRTERDEPVALPGWLVAKWDREGRRDREVAELDAFFKRTGHPRAPRWYIIKWLTDWVREVGFDGYRVDTAKHFEPSVSAELRAEAEVAFADWKRAHPDNGLDDLPFYMVGEVYGWSPATGRQYDFGDRQVDFFANGYDALINFEFKAVARGPLDSLYTRYSSDLHGGALDRVALLNYVSSHDDGGPYDRDRRDPMGAGTRLLLAPGGAQVYYGDELARPLVIPGAEGDANLRSMMNWGDTAGAGRAVLEHWRRLGRFRRAHPAVGAGVHRTLRTSPFLFSRTLDAGGGTDRVLVALDLAPGMKTIPLYGTFPDGAVLVDSYSGTRVTVRGGAAVLDTPFPLVLLSTP